VNDQMQHADEDAERAILGTILATGEVDRDHAVKLLTEAPAPEDYSRPAHEEIAQQLRLNAAAGDPLDAIAIKAGLDKRRARVGGAPYLHTIVSHAATPSSLPYYTTRIRSAAALRRAFTTVNRALNRLAAAEIDDEGDARSAVYEAMGDLEAIAVPPELAGTRSTWRPVDLTAVLDGSYVPPAPEIGTRSDGQALIYPGKQHLAFGETEAGKSWFALLLCIHEMNRGRNVVYLDFEDDPGEIINRMVVMGALPRLIATNFTYIRPEEPITLATNADLLSQLTGDLRPSLAIIDGITEAMTRHGLNLKENDEVALFNRAVAGRITASGAATLSLDHVTKDKETRGKYALGGVHKLNALNGAGFILENRAPFGIGITGRSAVYIAKDRNGKLRKYSQKVEGRDWFGDLVMEPLDPMVADNAVQAWIQPPELATRPRRPTLYMERVSKALQRANAPLSLRKILDRVDGKHELIRKAIASLVDEGYVREQPGARGATDHILIRPFDPDQPTEGPHDA
jgi:hypothetical protein